MFITLGPKLQESGSRCHFPDQLRKMEPRGMFNWHMLCWLFLYYFPSSSGKQLKKTAKSFSSNETNYTPFMHWQHLYFKKQLCFPTFPVQMVQNVNSVGCTEKKINSQGHWLQLLDYPPPTLHLIAINQRLRVACSACSLWNESSIHGSLVKHFGVGEKGTRSVNISTIWWYGGTTGATSFFLNRVSSNPPFRQNPQNNGNAFSDKALTDDFGGMDLFTKRLRLQPTERN